MSRSLRLARLLAVPAWLALATALPVAHAGAASMVAVVNGDAITSTDVDSRTRFFALATGQALSPDVLQRLRPQILQQLINERLELQEAERRQIVIPDKAVAHAIAEIEAQNGMQPGMLRGKLMQLGIGFDTLVAQVRTQLAWTQVLRQTIGQAGRPTPEEIDRRIAQMKSQGAQPQYNVGEIFIPVSHASAEADAQRFADTVITQLRAGAPFPIMAAQFSQGETALQGGSLGWVRGDQLDPTVLGLVKQMPIGAISNAVPVAGGIMIVQLRGRQQGGQMEMAQQQPDAAGGPAAPIGPDVVLHVRQVFLPFTARLDPQHPTAQQEQTMVKVHKIIASARSCADMDAANRANGASRPADPGPVHLAGVNPPAFRNLLSKMPINKVSPPLIADEGVSVVMVCSRGIAPATPPGGAPPGGATPGTATAAAPGASGPGANPAAGPGAADSPERQAVLEEMFNHRVELMAQQTLDNLRRQGSIQVMR